MVTKSAVMNMLETPSTWNRALASGSSLSTPLTNVSGPPTDSPTENFMALGFGVGAGRTGIGVERTPWT